MDTKRAGTDNHVYQWVIDVIAQKNIPPHLRYIGIVLLKLEVC